MVGQVVLGSFESFNLYALNQAHSTHHPVHAAYRYTSQITEPARGTILHYLVQPRQTGTTEEIEWFNIKRTADP